MPRLRQRGLRIHHPDEVAPGLLINMSYLPDLDRYDRYRRNDLSSLWGWYGTSREAREMSGLDRFIQEGAGGYNITRILPHINLFKSYSDAYDAAIFEQRPQLTGSPDDPWWFEHSEQVLREARYASTQHTMTGYGGLAVEQRLGAGAAAPTLYAPEMAGYIPIQDPSNPRLVLGHVLLTFWWAGERIASDFANRVTAQVWVDADGVALSDGRIAAPVNRRVTFGWASSTYNGVLGAIEEDLPGRMLGFQVFGEGESLYEIMESLVASIIIKTGTANAALAQQALSVLILPAATAMEQTHDQQGRLQLDPIKPVITFSDLGRQGGNPYGWVEGPGATMASALETSVEADLNSLAMLTGIGPEFFGMQGYAGESGEHRVQLLQTAKTRVIDRRVDIGMALDKLLPLIGGPAQPGTAWRYEPFEDQTQVDDRAVKLLQAGIISVTTAQEMTHSPLDPSLEKKAEEDDTDTQEGNDDG